MEVGAMGNPLGVESLEDSLPADRALVVLVRTSIPRYYH